MISHESWFSFLWNILDTIACLVSSYLVMIIAVFRKDKIGTVLIDRADSFELIFLLSMLKNFFTERVVEEDTVCDLEQISLHYLSNGFISDLIAIFPMPFLLKGIVTNYEFCYMIKIIRLYKGIQLFNEKQYLDLFKRVQKARLEKLIKNDPVRAQDMINDNNNIEVLFFGRYILRTIKLIALMFNLSFFLGMIWMIYCYFIQSVVDHDGDQEFFLEVYHMHL